MRFLQNNSQKWLKFMEPYLPLLMVANLGIFALSMAFKAVMFAWNFAGTFFHWIYS